MNYLRYSSNEMFSSTSLIRQSKQLFDKLSTKEIEKAVILRDGKPSFIMLDFELYEKIMLDYSKIKEASSNPNDKLNQTIQQNITQTNIQIDTQIEHALSDSYDDTPPNTADDLSNGLEVALNDEEKDEHNSEIKEFWNK